MPDLRSRDRLAEIARAFHEAYERLAPSFGYETRKESAVPWEDVPGSNRALMEAVVAEVVAPLVDDLQQELVRAERRQTVYLDLKEQAETRLAELEAAREWRFVYANGKAIGCSERVAHELDRNATGHIEVSSGWRPLAALAGESGPAAEEEHQSVYGSLPGVPDGTTEPGNHLW